MVNELSKGGQGLAGFMADEIKRDKHSAKEIKERSQEQMNLDAYRAELEKNQPLMVDQNFG